MGCIEYRSENNYQFFFFFVLKNSKCFILIRVLNRAFKMMTSGFLFTVQETELSILHVLILKAVE